MPAFPPGFTWGVSTASYQIEGAVAEGGRGTSVWDTFAHTPGRTRNGETGDVACDHYHRYAADVDLMADLGVDAYRFSVAWPRIQPDGVGPANPDGLDFYDRLVDALRAKGIKPLVTLFHWDLPQALEDKGGWLNRDTATRFAEYASLVAGRLGDRVEQWITLNEPFIVTSLGHVLGVHAPGRAGVEHALPVTHHLLLGHGLATAAIRRHSTAAVSLANNYSPAWAVGPDGRPETATDDDRAAAQLYDVFHNRLYTDPLLLGEYPPGVETLSPLEGLVLDGDMDTISQPLDALGVNYYNPTAVRAPQPGADLPFDLARLEGYERTGFDWPVVPAGLRELLVDLLHQRYANLPPLWITESGCAYPRSLDDQDRIAYHDVHVRAVQEAIAAGVDVRGYCAWSLMDNFEWAEGYSQRFGLVDVDFDTLVRTPRASYRWYRSLIRGE
ncbi:GH1 family beta-glucosidase [Virgisporangium aurantiacum]|uniref:Beta-glucosidase n=1 Tax=Virgisporangium aurantiacum TaxID=175570 RepID=A0A8J3Z6D5_9ACTN|nr:GH1 family beta-glucosidase [Virgisporangium aurantiacum]GIJ55793.1 beta-glucosidase [Virgisporangium aurantiacum]